ncbi:MAG: carbon-phosphorus lyase complex subunit PhnI [Lautropia sp.]
MYIAVKGGEQAIEASYRLLDEARRGSGGHARLGIGQLVEQLGLLVDRVMADAGVHDPRLAALAIRQARGDLVEASFLLRAYRTTLPRFVDSLPLDTARMRVDRRVSAIFKDLPGGQLLGATFDYTQRLLDDDDDDGDDSSDGSGDGSGDVGPTAPTDAATRPRAADARSGEARDARVPGALDALAAQGLLEPASPADGDPDPQDITRSPPSFPLERSARLQMMARSDEGWLLGMAYSTQRGYANSHPFAGDLRIGKVALEIEPPELGFAISVGEIVVSECQMLTQFTDTEASPRFTRGYGLTVGATERKAMAMALVDRAQRHDEFGECADGGLQPAQDAEFVLMHGDSVEASGFVQHLKLPHYVTFESELALLRALRGEQT